MGLPRRPPKTNGNPVIPLLNHGGIQPALSLPLEMHALYYYADSVSMERYVLGDAGYDYGSHVLLHWQSAEPDSCLRLALTAYSHAVLGQNRGVRPALCLAQRVYARAVETIREAMRRISGDTIYQVLLAMMLMGGYENVMYLSREPAVTLPPDAVGSRFWKNVCHEKGAAALLSVRRERGFAANAELDKAIRQKCLRIIILRGGEMPGWLEDGRSWGEAGHELELDSLMVRVVVLRNKSVSLLRDVDAADLETVDEVRSIAMEAYTLDCDLASWPLGLSQDWNHSQSSTDSSSHRYSSASHAAIWNQYRALRLITNGIQRRALAILQPLLHDTLLDANMQRCQENINELAVDMRRGAEFLAASRIPARGAEAATPGDMPHPGVAAILAWPLTVAVSVDAVQASEGIRLKSALKAVARSLGDTLLESVTDEGEFTF